MRSLIAVVAGVSAVVAAVALGGGVAVESIQLQPVGAISGTVVDSAGHPIGGVRVAIAGPPHESHVMTDDQGRFVFERVPVGRVMLTARKHGYLDSMPSDLSGGSSAGRGISVVLEDKAWLKDLRLVMARGSALNGTVRGESGSPLVQVPVRVMRRLWVSSNPRWSIVAWTTTNDLGEYRVGRLEEGHYVVAVPLPIQSVPTTPPSTGSSPIDESATSCEPLGATSS